MSGNWQRFCNHLYVCDSVGLRLDTSRMRAGGDLLDRLDGPMHDAYDAMQQLERGAIANPDENRMVGHYWLRAPDLAPDSEIRGEIADCFARIRSFAEDVQTGRIASPTGEPFKNLLLIGIGGSALGPQLVDDALDSGAGPMRTWFMDNTDPDGIDRTLAQIGRDLGRTLAVVISKSGGTKETRNGMLEATRAYTKAGLSFPRFAVAVTGEGSALFEQAQREEWLDTFPMWDWVGGRTSVTSAVGLLPASLQGYDVTALLDGAREMDAVTRRRDTAQNPAALLALMWYDAAEKRGLRDMVVIPYKDRLVLFSRYLQQLVMESLGKQKDLDGKTVNQGLTVYGNKGSTDQHAYVQQLREGLHNFFVTFIEVLRDRSGSSIEVEPQVTSGDYLHGFLLGTREALYDNGRESITITIDEVSAYSLGALIALFERAVGFFASLVNINAYHQPGVEAGKKAAGRVIALQAEVCKALAARPGEKMSADQIAAACGREDEAEWVYMILEHLAANPDRGVERVGSAHPAKAHYRWLGVTGPLA